MAAHTPGPWKALRRNAFGDILVGPAALPVATVGHGERDDPEADANARLIAAAPELLGALKKCVAHIREITHDFDDPEDEAPELVAIDALIAKLEGREP